MFQVYRLKDSTGLFIFYDAKAHIACNAGLPIHWLFGLPKWDFLWCSSKSLLPPSCAPCELTSALRLELVSGGQTLIQAMEFRAVFVRLTQQAFSAAFALQTIEAKADFQFDHCFGRSEAGMHDLPFTLLTWNRVTMEYFFAG